MTQEKKGIVSRLTARITELENKLAMLERPDDAEIERANPELHERYVNATREHLHLLTDLRSNLLGM